MNYIGNQKVVNEIEKDGVVEVTLKDKTSFEINKELLEKIKTEKNGNGNITDVVSDYFSRKFLAELAYYDLDYMFALSASSGVATLAHNLRESAIGNKFDCSCSETIKLSKIVEEL